MMIMMIMMIMNRRRPLGVSGGAVFVLKGLTRDKGEAK